MNYLAHGISVFHNSEQLLGSILPDVVRKTDLGKKPSKEFWLSSFFTSEIKTGIQFHFQQDFIFHNSNFFQSFTSKTHNWPQTPILGKYGFFFRHVYLEFCLDRYLVERNLIQPELYYQKLNEVLQSNTFNNFPDWLKKRIENWVSHPYLIQFNSNQAVYTAVEKTAQLLGLQISNQEINELPPIFELHPNLWESTEFYQLLQELSWEFN